MGDRRGSSRKAILQRFFSSRLSLLSHSMQNKLMQPRECKNGGVGEERERLTWNGIISSRLAGDFLPTTTTGTTRPAGRFEVLIVPVTDHVTQGVTGVVAVMLIVMMMMGLMVLLVSSPGSWSTGRPAATTTDDPGIGVGEVVILLFGGEVHAQLLVREHEGIGAAAPVLDVVVNVVVVVVDLCIGDRVRDRGTDHAPVHHFSDDDAVCITNEGSAALTFVLHSDASCPRGRVVVVVIVVVLGEGTIEVVHVCWRDGLPLESECGRVIQSQ